MYVPDWIMWIMSIVVAVASGIMGSAFISNWSDSAYDNWWNAVIGWACFFFGAGPIYWLIMH